MATHGHATPVLKVGPPPTLGARTSKQSCNGFACPFEHSLGPSAANGLDRPSCCPELARLPGADRVVIVAEGDMCGIRKTSTTKAGRLVYGTLPVPAPWNQNASVSCPWTVRHSSIGLRSPWYCRVSDQGITCTIPTSPARSAFTALRRPSRMGVWNPCCRPC